MTSAPILPLLAVYDVHFDLMETNQGPEFMPETTLPIGDSVFGKSALSRPYHLAIVTGVPFSAMLAQVRLSHADVS